MPMLDQDLLNFIRSSIRSVWTLELLLLLRRESKEWTSSELVRELRASTTVVETSLESLQASGLISCHEGRCAYRPAAPVLDELCGALERAYAEQPVRIVNEILSPKSKMQGFADAFRLKDHSE